MKGILIDPTARTVTSAEYNGDYRQIYELIGCRTFTAVQLSDCESLFVDDEGLLCDEPGPFFQIRGYPQPLAGRGLILGVDDGGESVATSLSVAKVRRSVIWPQVEVVGFATRTYEDHGWTVIENRPKFKPKGGL